MSLGTPLSRALRGGEGEEAGLGAADGSEEVAAEVQHSREACGDIRVRNGRLHCCCRWAPAVVNCVGSWMCLSWAFCANTGLAGGRLSTVNGLLRCQLVVRGSTWIAERVVSVLPFVS